MSDEPHKSKSWVASALVMVPILYVLGVGPANWLYDHSSSPEFRSALEAPYLPLFQIVTLFGNDSFLGNALDWYLEWWES